jgi:hypothetical protein
VLNAGIERSGIEAEDRQALALLARPMLPTVLKVTNRLRAGGYPRGYPQKRTPGPACPLIATERPVLTFPVT